MGARTKSDGSITAPVAAAMKNTADSIPNSPATETPGSSTNDSLGLLAPPPLRVRQRSSIIDLALFRPANRASTSMNNRTSKPPAWFKNIIATFNKPKHNILTLPLEVRKIIYEHVFTPEPLEELDWPLEAPSRQLRFLLTCKQIYEEAHEIAFSQMLFAIDASGWDDIWQAESSAPLSQLLSKLRPERITPIKRLLYHNSSFAAANVFSSGTGPAGYPKALPSTFGFFLQDVGLSRLEEVTVTTSFLACMRMGYKGLGGSCSTAQPPHIIEVDPWLWYLLSGTHNLQRINVICELPRHHGELRVTNRQSDEDHQWYSEDARERWKMDGPLEYNDSSSKLEYTLVCLEHPKVKIIVLTFSIMEVYAHYNRIPLYEIDYETTE